MLESLVKIGVLVMQAEILVHGNRYGITQIINYWGHDNGWKHLQHQVEHQFLETKIQNHLFGHPELFGYGWQRVAKNQSLQNVIQQLDGKIDRVRKELKKCADLVLRRDNEILVVEIMRPNLRTDVDHVQRIQHYKAYLSGYLQTYSVRGLLIADDAIDPGVLQLLKNLPSNNIQFLTWHQFVERSKPEFRTDIIRYIDSAVNQIAGLLPPASEPSMI
jgi:hypothetical protein